MSAADTAFARRNPVVQVASKLSFAVALLLLGVLLAGLALGGTWSGEATATVRASADVVFDLLESPRRWDEWTPWPSMAFTYQGPPGGAGAARSWDDPQLGTGSFTVTEASRPFELRYVVSLDGSTPTVGSFHLEPSGEGTRVTWREEGDLGRNPMLGWAALSLRRKHSDRLEERLQGLAAAAEGIHPPVATPDR